MKGEEYSLWEEDTVDGDSFWSGYFPREKARDGRGKTHGFVDTGFKVVAVSELFPTDNLRGICEYAADFVLEDGELVRVTGEIEHCC